MVRGEVQEKEAAKDAYEDAIAAGGKAALVEESAASRDVFTTTLGNLGPGQSATVEITVVSPLQCSGGEHQARDPNHRGTKVRARLWARARD